MTTAPPVQCLSCTHLHPVEPTPGVPAGYPPVVSCDAFPQRIPRDIAAYGADHRTARGDEVDGITHDLDPALEHRFESWRKTFAPTAAELAQRRLTMEQPVDLVFIEE